MGNLALDQELGQDICQKPGLERLLSLFSKKNCKLCKEMTPNLNDLIDYSEGNDEMVLNVLAALANYTFYKDVPNNVTLSNTKALMYGIR
jgi:hypothetical protein